VKSVVGEGRMGGRIGSEDGKSEGGGGGGMEEWGVGGRGAEGRGRGNEV